MSALVLLAPAAIADRLEAVADRLRAVKVGGVR